MKKSMISLIVLLAIAVVGCTMTIDPVTGEKGYAVKESVVKVIDTIGTTAEIAGPMTGGIVGTILGIVVSVFGCYQTWKKPLTESGIMLDKVTAGLRAAGDVIEEVVKPNVASWATAKPILKLAAKNGSINADKL